MNAQQQAALHHHLNFNMIPAMPFMTEAAQQAIAYANEGVTPKDSPQPGYVKAPPQIADGRTDAWVPASEVIQNLQLDFFVEDDDE